MRNLTKFLPALALMLVLTMVGSAQALILNGNVLKVGVDQSGGMVDITGVYPVNGQGITYKPGGIANDFTAPGTPWEFYSIGVNGAVVVGGVPGAAANPLNLVTTDWSVGNDMLATSTDGNFLLGGAKLKYHQDIYFDTNSNVLHVSAQFVNTGATTATNLVYARGMDPDPDSVSNAYAAGAYRTNNTFPGAGSVMATGPLTGLYVRMDSQVPGAVASISDSFPTFPWETNPYTLLVGGLLNGALAGNPWDYSINLAWSLGDLEPGVSKEIDFTYTFGVPLPPSVLLLGSGLLGLGFLRFRRKATA